MSQPDWYAIQSKRFKALAHPVRLQILDVLRGGEACVCHMEAALGYRQAYISQQLSVLRDLEMIKDRRDGLNIYYVVTRPEVFDVMDAAQGLGDARKDRKAAKRLDNCNCPHCAPQKAPAVC